MLICLIPEDLSFVNSACSGKPVKFSKVLVKPGLDEVHCKLQF
jgi:hypothetical protein